MHQIYNFVNIGNRPRAFVQLVDTIPHSAVGRAAGWTEYKEPMEKSVYDSEDNAVRAGQQRGMQIIDGKFPDVTLKF